MNVKRIKRFEFIGHKLIASSDWSTCITKNCSSSQKKRLIFTNKTMKVHVKCRGTYPGTEIERFQFSDDKVSWKVEFTDYKPVNYTAPSVLNKPVWADPDIDEPEFKDIKFNTIDGKVNRKSHEGIYEVVNGVPLNIRGRTGMIGRGLLGRWGPNHAADPIVTRWKRLEDGTIEMKNNKKVLEFVAIQRKDNGEWAIPGGMVDPGESLSVTLKREFGEESMNTGEMDEEKKKAVEENLNKWFKDGVEIYKGYVDDPRNTDNAWMETYAVNFHDETGETFGKINLNPGDDAGKVKWLPISSELKLYASHYDFIKKVADLRDCYW